MDKSEALIIWAQHADAQNPELSEQVLVEMHTAILGYRAQPHWDIWSRICSTADRDKARAAVEAAGLRWDYRRKRAGKAGCVEYRCYRAERSETGTLRQLPEGAILTVARSATEAATEMAECLRETLGFDCGQSEVAVATNDHSECAWARISPADES